MDYKAIFIDLDGTLLSHFKRISQTSVKAIKAAQKRGILVVINSGRTPYEIERILRKSSLYLPYIALNGAYVRIMNEKKAIYKKHMGYDLCKEMLHISEKYKNNSFWYTARYSYAYHLQRFSWLSKYAVLQYLYEHAMLLSRRFIKSNHLKAELLAGNIGVYKCGFMSADKGKLAAIRKEIDGLGRFETALTAPVFLECNLRGVTKGSGLKKMMQYYNMSAEEAIAIGDSENDIPMLQSAGLGIAMENASDKVKQAAGLLADTNARNGVAKVIHQYFL
ncbi:haloacid dehalogenase [Anaerocolumna cellulosilytica]|uniref:Haloacid dehalogenase n=1 Tax=Anaerocolumna cellulosilytica TaxID=433286 RepID=A0A6S6R489_9FIRM|nr:Cof-type HAD-IIB family hydrolase [Anaerocolumna cellulosilytica]MBB5196657.1 hypothetical protein [Anaerocolumna cellulosilytica]BCJ93921.1 haloacid dehalogenase [Anaerocolumna cellulosilytica]